jgi:GNAT superfamily N-acetyltransferase
VPRIPARVQLRAARRGDAAAILTLIRRFYAHEGLTYRARGTRSALERLLADRSLGAVWVATDGGVPVGYLVVGFGYSLEFLGRDAFVDELYLDPPYRGHGLGRRFLQAAERACRARGVHALHLEVDPGNAVAHGLYRWWGFVDHHRRLMTRWLRPARKARR